MTDAIIWLVTLGLIGLMFWSLVYEQRQRAKMTDEEYQRRAKEEPSLLSKAVMSFDQIIFHPQAKAAIEYQKDKMRGQTPDQQVQGEKLPEVAAPDENKQQ